MKFEFRICKEFFRRLLPDKVVNYLFHLPKAALAVLFYGYPAKNLTIIGVTGTDGKTTTTTLIYEILRQAGKKTALISTVSAKIGRLDLPTGLHVTSPDPWELQRLLKIIKNKGFQYVVLELTSHGLDQFRLFGCNFYLGVLTNITNEHLDYHRTYNNYLKAKARLFKKTKFSILNKDDSSYGKIRKLAGGEIITYGLKNGDYNLKKYPFETPLLGNYNLSNCLAAVSAAKILKIKDEKIRQALKEFKGVVGRMDEIKNKRNFRVFIDFAHTPNALKNALITLRSLKPRKLIVVFGCAGLRDRRKRPQMGRIACQLANKVILTAEDPRTENVNKIIRQISRGCEEKSKIIIEPNRQKAIDLAINKIAQKGDLIGIFGKGHEQSMCFGRIEYDWSDHKAVLKALKNEQYENVLVKFPQKGNSGFYR